MTKPLPEGWNSLPFEKSVSNVKVTEKLPKKFFLKTGKYPVVSQEKDLINGYSNNNEAVFYVSKPVVVFGDHTKTIKYIDFDFIIGADGVKILEPISKIDSKFFYYYISQLHLRDLGYARHYRLLKQCQVIFPSLPEQRRIAAKLDKIFADIDKAKEYTAKNLQNAKEVFYDYLTELFTVNSSNWKKDELQNVAVKISAGGDKPASFSKEPSDKYNIPIYANAEKNNGLFGFTDVPAINQPAITISARGTIGFVCKRTIPYFPIVRLLSVIPNLQKISLDFLFYCFKFLIPTGNGTSIPQLTKPMLKKFPVFYPVSLSEQDRIVRKLDNLYSKTQELEKIYTKKLADLDELKQSILQQAFSGKL